MKNRNQKRPYRANPTGRIAHAREVKAARENASEGINRKILEAVSVLTPSPCPDCSTQELLSFMHLGGSPALSQRGIGSRLGLLRGRGLITSRVLSQRHLWSLTAKGKSALGRPAK
jgi:hypothetical protein